MQRSLQQPASMGVDMEHGVLVPGSGNSMSGQTSKLRCIGCVPGSELSGSKLQHRDALDVKDSRKHVRIGHGVVESGNSASSNTLVYERDAKTSAGQQGLKSLIVSGGLGVLSKDEKYLAAASLHSAAYEALLPNSQRH